MEVFVSSGSGTYNITQLVIEVKWSGDYQQAARSLDISVLSSPTDSSIPVVEYPLGGNVQLFESGYLLFDGFIVSRSMDTNGATVHLSCFDRGFYLKRNKALYKFESVTPEEVVHQIASEFGFSLGTIASTGFELSRTFISGKDSLYDIILTVYTLASQSTGKRYHVGFQGRDLCVAEKAVNDRTLVIQGGSNLISASKTDSIKGMINSVDIYDINGNFVRTVDDAGAKAEFGCIQEIVKQTATDDKAAEAQKLLDDNGVSETITVRSLGNIQNVTGGTVVVRESYTGIYGLFYIDNDQHEWKRGQYFNKLVLNLNNIMNEMEVGSLPGRGG